MTQQLTMDNDVMPSDYPHIRNVIRDPDTLYVLNWGVGKNSSAAIALLIKLGVPLDAILFADTGNEMPETMAWMPKALQWIKDNAPHIPVYVVRSKRGLSISAFYKSRKILPIVARRHCTVDFKIIPVRQKVRKLMKTYKKKKVLQYIGIGYDEVHRVKPADRKYITHCYPLVDLRINREMCDRIIAGMGLPLPIKSGCYFCPFQSKKRWHELYNKHPVLFNYAKRMEGYANDTFNHKKNGKVKVPLTVLEDSFKTQTNLDLDDHKFSMCGGEGGCMDG